MNNDDRSLATLAGPLAGVRVVEMSGIGPCPFAAMALADMGAEVVRIVRPEVVDDARDSVLRGRRNVALDLKQPPQRDSLRALIQRADILLEGYRPGVMERLELGPDECCERNIRLIYARITGWGQTGPLAHTAGHDINYIALSGALDSIGSVDGGPIPPLNLVGDYGGGAMFVLVGILAALHERHQSGRGQVIDSAMVDGAASLMSALYAWKAMDMWPGRRGSNLLDGGAPFYGTYRCADDRFIAVGCMERKFFDVMLRLMGLNADEFEGRDDRTQWAALRDKLQDRFRSRTRDEWCSLLEGSDACCAPVLSMEEAKFHPHVSARRIFSNWNGVLTPAMAPRLSRTPNSIGSCSGTKKDDIESILRQWAKPV